MAQADDDRFSLSLSDDDDDGNDDDILVNTFLHTKLPQFTVL